MSEGNGQGGDVGGTHMLNIQLKPGEELCECSTCRRLAHEPMSLRVPRSRFHKLMDARRNGYAQQAEKRRAREVPAGHGQHDAPE